MDLEDPPEQVFGGIDPEKALIDNHEVGELQQHVGRKMLQLDLVFMEEPTKEVRGQDPKPTLMVVREGHHLPRTQLRKLLSGGGSPPSHVLGREEMPLSLSPYGLTSVITNDIQEPILQVEKHGVAVAERATSDVEARRRS